MGDVNNSPVASTRSSIPRPSRLPLPSQSLRQATSRSSLRSSANTIPVARLRPKQSIDVLAPTQATSTYDRDVDTGVRTPQKAPVLRSKPSNSSFKELQSRYEPALVSTAQAEISEDPTEHEPRSRKPRPSLSERAQETLAQIPPSPVVNRRKSSFFNPESPMRPPSRSTNGSRPGSSYENDGKMRPPSRQASSRPGSSAGYNTQAVPIDFRASTNSFKPNLHTPVKRQSMQTLKTPKSVSLRLAAASKTPGATNPTTPYKPTPPALGVKSGSKTVGRAIRPRASVTGLFDEQPFEPIRPAESKTPRTVRPRASIGSFSKPTLSELPNAGSPRTSVGLKKVSPTFSNASSTSASTISHASKESMTTVGSPQNKETTPKKSSTALREQIAKAKAAKRAVMTKTTPIAQSEGFAEEAPVIPSGTFDFGLDDPFNQNGQDPSKGLLRKRIDSARTDGRLNIAAMGFKEIPDEVMNMYNLEDINGQASSWAESVDLTRFVAADNELETIGDDIFPDMDPRDSADDDDARGNQFGGLETLDLHGNTLISIPSGLRRLELLTTLNLSNNKLQNECFEIISQITSLRDLKIANNSLCSEVSNGLLKLVNLEVLDLHNNQLSSLPAGLGDLARLRILNLSQNTFTSLPFNAFQRLPLIELTVANNKLCGTLIQSNAAEFPKLRTLDISGNSIKAISSGSLSLPSLQLLTVSANRLTHLPNVSTWVSLITLSASDNSISALPEGFISLPILKTADLQGNDLRVLDENIALMDSLDTLLVSGNPLREKKFSGMNTADLKKVLKERLEPDEPEPVPETFAEVQDNGFGAPVTRDDDSDTGTEYLDAPSTPTLPRSPSASEWSINTTLGILDRSYSQSYSLNPLVAAQIASENKIKTMELHHNSFTEIPTSIAFFGITLTTLNMSHNSLTSDTFMKDEIELPALKELNLSSNTFSSLSPILRLLSAPRLEKLDVQGSETYNSREGDGGSARMAARSDSCLRARRAQLMSEVEWVRGVGDWDVASHSIRRLTWGNDRSAVKQRPIVRSSDRCCGCGERQGMGKERQFSPAENATLRALPSIQVKLNKAGRATMATRKILITGATGKQGGAVIDALLSSSSSFQILALTRNASSKGAQSLASKSNVTVVEGDPSSPASIFQDHSPIHAVFSVTAVVVGKPGAEESQAIPLIDESIKNKVDHFVFTSVDRGGPGTSEKNPTNIEHFASKHRIEEYLKEKSGNGSKMAFTILRPVAFMDNLTPDFFGRAFASMWRGVGNKPLQLISVHDIGIVAAKALLNPEYKGRVISLAGDELTLEQGRAVFQETMGYAMPETFGFVGTGIKLMMKEMGNMFKWFETDGFGADIVALRKEEPALQNFGTWLKESSKFSKQ
ncbi:hypothetical protein V494_00866 [Pseudogymnoascus sp. VKM F-4513 (FW-928)]|nr:hypothetical protein V494_00866 [Pseudogymnoascus sp. VKM F-4513 (FW-928)]